MVAKWYTPELLERWYRDQHCSSLLLHYSSLSCILLSIAVQAGIYWHAADPCEGGSIFFLLKMMPNFHQQKVWMIFFVPVYCMP